MVWGVHLKLPNSILGGLMPNYEYTCECGKTFEKIMRMQDRHTVQCSCGRLAKLKIMPVPFKFTKSTYVFSSETGELLHRGQTKQTIGVPGV